MASPEPLSFPAPVLLHETGFRQHYLPVPPDVAEALAASGTRRVVATLNGHTVRRALQSRTASGPHLVLSLDLMRTLGVTYGDFVAVDIVSDLEPDRIDLGELAAALEADPEAKARFDAFTPGQQRSLAFHVTSAKRPATREARAEDLAVKIRTHQLDSDRPDATP